MDLDLGKSLLLNSLVKPDLKWQLQREEKIFVSSLSQQLEEEPVMLTRFAELPDFF